MMGYYFYFPRKNKVVVTMYAEFLEKILLSQEISGRAEELEEIQDEDTSPYENTSEMPMDVEGFEPPQEEVVPIRRPDVAFAQNITTRFQQDPGELHWTTVKTILKYLRNTKDMFLVYGGNLKAELRVDCYCDAGFETDRDDTKSQTEAAYIAASKAGIEVVRIRKFISRLSIIGTFRETLTGGEEGAFHLGLGRTRVYSDLSPEDMERYNADIRATNILLQGLPKDIYTLINHYTDAKDILNNVKMLLEGLPKDIYTLINHYTDAKYILNNVKMLLEGSDLTKKDRESSIRHSSETKQRIEESNYDQVYAYLKQHEAHGNENKMMLERFTQHMIAPLTLMTNVSPHRVDRTEVRGTNAAGNGGAQNRVRNVNPGQARVVLDEEQLLFIAGCQDNVVDENVDEPPVQDLALNVDNEFQADECDAFDYDVVDENVDEPPVQDLALNVDNEFQADECDAFDSDVDEAPTTQTMFMANLSFAYPVYNEAGLSYDSNILSEVYDHDNYQDAVCEHHKVHEMHDDVPPNCVLDSYAEYTGDSNMTSYDQYVKDNAELVCTK
uniref:Integrase, catalytic region, zinc finger, CCHC-type, peptidase aspartic, catalytic n=1 Tax=Tanacetum cinerariifolium TaxID=118510 RepID=A0A6L2P8J8_TANCI|nr:hypothetical protein [Tanacetum cinerariifolium]